MKKLTVIIIAMVYVTATSQAQSRLESNFAGLAGDILENLQSFFPVRATEKGSHNYDYKLTDYSDKSIKDEISRLRGYEKRLRKYQGTSLSQESRIKYRLLKSEVDIALHDLHRLKLHKRNPYLYVKEAIDGVYLILTSRYAPLEERAQNIVARMKATPDLFRQARTNLKSPAPIYTRLALETLAEGVEFLKTARDELMQQIPELATEIQIAAEKAIASMTEFHRFLDGIEPGGENSFAMGKDDFDYKLKHQYFLNYDSDSLLRIGEAMLYEADSMYREYLAYLDSMPGKNDSVYVIGCIEKKDLLNYYNWEVEQTRVFLEAGNIVTVPDDIGDCIVVETPPFLQNVISSIAYHPPGVFSPDQTGYFYVRPIADSLDQGQREAYYRYIHRRGFKGAVVHEAYPGHHLQFQIASRTEDSVRKWAENMLMVEGWALYCEQMMYENGFYESDPRRYLNILRGIRFRAARIIADVRLHVQKTDIDEVIAWMVEAVDADTASVRAEINRYVLQPTVPMSYLIGKLEIIRLRDAAKEREGDSFSLKEFHDRLLAEGALPPALLWEIWGLSE
ncbi:MAG: DUF885 domain-containing protein [Candidatus Zixiibacteriota bacterium]|nr:MAG: DUF885 domain-containing protein [candidate division Zixibacteria bacterium]